MAINPLEIKFGGDARAFFAELGKVRNDLGSLRNEASKVNQVFSKVGQAIGGYLSFRALTSVIGAVVRETAAAEAAQAQLNNALQAAGAEVKAASAEFQGFAAQLQKTTTFGDDAIIQVETLLLSFQGLSGETVKRATESVLDLSTRMGMDAPAAAKLLGKALSDPEKGLNQLARAGVGFSDTQKLLIRDLAENGRQMEAQAIILDTLKERFGGAAEAARNTFGGAISGLQNAFGDLLEGKGGINAASESINELTEVLASPQTQQAFATMISGLATVIRLTAEAAVGLVNLFDFDRLRPERSPLEDQIFQVENRLAGREAYRGADGKNETEQLRRAIANDRGELNALRARLAEERELARQQAVYGEPLRRFGIAGDDNAKAALSFVTGGAPEEGESEEARKKRQRRELDEMNFRITMRQDYFEALAGLEADALAAGDELAKLSLEQNLQLYDAELQAARDSAAERVKIEQEAQDAMQTLRAGALNGAMGLLQAMAQRSKTAAKALIAINKAIAINQVIQNTAAAVMATAASNGGLPFAAPAIASVKALGAAQIGMIAATGAIEIAAVGAGRGGSVVGPGTPNNPLYTREGDSGAAPGVSQTQSVVVNITGVVTDEVLEELFDGLSGLVSRRDRIFIKPNSRNAQEIRDA